MESLTNPRQERRKAPRTQLKEILYINLEPDNGGIVVNLSEEGLSFRSATPIRQALHPDEPVRLAFLLPGGKQIKVSAAVVWTGQTRKTGGLRFTNLSVATRAQILSLIAETSAGGSATASAIPVAAEEAESAQPLPVQPAPSIQEVPSVQTSPLGLLGAQSPAPQSSSAQSSAVRSSAVQSSPGQTAPAATLVADLPHLSPLPNQKLPEARRTPDLRGAPAEQKPGTSQTPVGAQTPVTEPPPPQRSFQVSDSTYYPRTRAKDAWLPPENPRSYGGVIVTLLVVALLAGAGWLGYTHRQDVGAQMIQWGQQLQGSSQVASQVPQQSTQPATPQPADQNAVTTQTANAAPQPPPSTTTSGSAASASVPPTSPEAAAPTDAPPPAQAPAEPNISSRTNTSPAASKQPSGTREATDARRSGVRTPDDRTIGARDQQSSSDLEDAAADVAAARRYLEGTGGSRNSAAAAQLLWAAVAKGDPEAEATLARLYLNGDGVARSCEQARVLLKAASDHGDSQAEETLTQVNRTRCR